MQTSDVVAWSRCLNFTEYFSPRSSCIATLSYLQWLTTDENTYSYHKAVFKRNQTETNFKINKVGPSQACFILSLSKSHAFMSFENVQYFAAYRKQTCKNIIFCLENRLGSGNVWTIYLYLFTKFMVIKVIRNIM